MYLESSNRYIDQVRNYKLINEFNNKLNLIMFGSPRNEKFKL